VFKSDKGLQQKEIIFNNIKKYTMNTQEIKVKNKREIGTVTLNRLSSTVTINVTNYDYDRTIVMCYDTLLQLAIEVVENHNKATTIAELEQSGKI
jgi:hypothetical protein